MITLTIIGVVAALTLPQRIVKYQKQQVEVKLEKFYSTFNQALKRSIEDNGDMSGWTYAGLYDWENSKIFWEKYLQPYISYTGTKDNSWAVWPTVGYEVLLPDGSSFQIAGTWITYYPNAKDSGNHEKTWRTTFLFTINTQKNIIQPYAVESNSMTSLLNECNKEKPYQSASKNCAAVIMKNGWKIPDIYPW